jgi:hypothetical protein
MEFEVNGAKYRTQKMSAFDQFHVARKLAPVVGSIGSISALASGDVSALGPLTKAISELPEEDCNMILQKCLSVVSRGDTTAAGTTWAPIWSTSAKRFMFEDIDMMAMIQIAGRVIQESLGSFTSALPSGSFLAVR